MGRIMYGYEITGELKMKKRDDDFYIEIGEFKITLSSFVVGLLLGAFLVWVF